MKHFDCPLVHENMIRAGIFKIEDVLPFIVKDKNSKNAVRIYGGHKVNMYTKSLHTFKKSIKCAGCGIQGQYFALEKHNTLKDDGYSLYLYAKLSTGDEVLMNKDHIYPRSKGGKGLLNNFQTMCLVCNRMKSDIVYMKEIDIWILKFKRKVYESWRRFKKLLTFLRLMEPIKSKSLKFSIGNV